MFFLISFFELPFVLLLPKNLLVIINNYFLKVQIKYITNNLIKKTLTYFVTLHLKYFLKMKSIYLLILYLVCSYSFSQIEETEVVPRWQLIGSNSDGSVLLKLNGENLFNFSFRNYQFSDKQVIKKIYFKSSDLDISNLYNFLFESFKLIQSDQSSFKIDNYVFQVLKNRNDLRIDIMSINSNEVVGWKLITIRDLNNLFGKY
jgi:hypothetical protein